MRITFSYDTPQEAMRVQAITVPNGTIEEAEEYLIGLLKASLRTFFVRAEAPYDIYTSAREAAQANADAWLETVSRGDK